VLCPSMALSSRGMLNMTLWSSCCGFWTVCMKMPASPPTTTTATKPNHPA
ncbi:hypothetical protein M9458_013655, partial [Cirrhinus mrigala]